MGGVIQIGYFFRQVFKYMPTEKSEILGFFGAYVLLSKKTSASRPRQDLGLTEFLQVLK